MSYKILVPRVVDRKIDNLLITLDTEKGINELTMEDFIGTRARQESLGRPRFLSRAGKIDCTIKESDWLPILGDIDEFISNHTLNTTYVRAYGASSSNYWEIYYIVPLLKLQDSENSRDMCLVLLGKMPTSGRALLRAIPIAQLCLWLGEKKARESRYKITGEQVEFLDWHLMNSNGYLEEFIATSGMFTSTDNVQVAKLIVDKNNTLIGVPYPKPQSGRHSEPLVMLVDLENVSRVGLFSILPSEKDTIVVLNWQHLRSYDLQSLSANKVLMLDLNTTKMGMEKQINTLLGLFMLDYSLMTESHGHAIHAPNVGVNAEDMVNNLRSTCQLINYVLSYSAGEMRDRTFGNRVYVLIDSTVPFVDGQKTMIDPSIQDYRRVEKKFNRLYNKYGDNPVKEDPALKIEWWVKSSNNSIGFLIPL